jgi:hypothetical protein
MRVKINLTHAFFILPCPISIQKQKEAYGICKPLVSSPAR